MPKALVFSGLSDGWQRCIPEIPLMANDPKCSQLIGMVKKRLESQQSELAALWPLDQLLSKDRSQESTMYVDTLPATFVLWQSCQALLGAVDESLNCTIGHSFGLLPAVAAAATLQDKNNLSPFVDVIVLALQIGCETRKHLKWLGIDLAIGAQHTHMLVLRQMPEELTSTFESCVGLPLEHAVDNGDDIQVLSGHPLDLEAVKLKLDKGATKPLPAGAPWHNSMLAPVVEKVKGIAQVPDWLTSELPCFPRLPSGRDGLDNLIERILVDKVVWPDIIQEALAAQGTMEMLDLHVLVGSESLGAQACKACEESLAVVPVLPWLNDMRADNATAIIGTSAEFAGADGMDEYLVQMVKNCSSVSPLSTRFPDVHMIPDFDIEAASLLESPFMFDNQYFKLSPSEAAAMDSQQRLALQGAAVALARADIPQGSDTAVIMATMSLDAILVADRSGELTSHTAAGAEPSMLAGRLSFILNLTGQSSMLDTACSGSLVALEVGVRQPSSTALVGGISLFQDLYMFKAEKAANMLSKDGRCRTFDASVDGYGRGEGVGFVVAEKLHRALRRTALEGVVAGIKSNHCGKSAGPNKSITYPSDAAQSKVMKEAIRLGDIGPEDIEVVEAHGTGTPVGDSVEVTAIRNALNKGKAVLTAGKSNMGHSEGAAGVAGLLKGFLMLSHSIAPPVHGLKDISSKVSQALEGTQLSIATECLGVPSRGSCLVNSFGFSGTNAAAVLKPVPACLREGHKVRTEAIPTFQKKLFLPPGLLAGGPMQELELGSTDLIGHNICGEALVPFSLSCLLAAQSNSTDQKSPGTQSSSPSSKLEGSDPDSARGPTLVEGLMASRKMLLPENGDPLKVSLIGTSLRKSQESLEAVRWTSVVPSQPPPGAVHGGPVLPPNVRAEEIVPKDAYTDLKAVGYEYGENFQLMESGASWVDKIAEGCGHVRVPRMEGAQAITASARALDACLHIGLASLQPPSEVALALRLPHRVKHFWSDARKLDAATDLWCFSTMTKHDERTDAVTFDVHVYDSELGGADHLVAAFLSLDAVAYNPLESNGRKLCFRHEWRPFKPQRTLATLKPMSTPSFLEVCSGKPYFSEVALRPSDGDEEALKGKAMLVITIDDDNDEGSVSPPEVQDLVWSVKTLLDKVASLANSSPRANAQVPAVVLLVRSQDPASFSQLRGQPLRALLQTASNEALVQSGLIIFTGLELSSDRFGPGHLQALLEVFGFGKDFELLQIDNDGTLHRRQWVEQRLPSLVPLGTRRTSERRCTILVGGTGGVGRDIISHMLEAGVDRLLVASRNRPDWFPENDDRQVWCKLDVCDLQSVKDMFEIAMSKGCLDYVFNFSGVLADKLLKNMTETKFAKVWGPKAFGTWNLHLVMRELGLEAMLVPASSISSTLCLNGQGNYSSANAFMDALAERRQEMGLPGLSIQLGAISSGMATNEKVEENLRERGLAFLSAQDVGLALQSLVRSSSKSRTTIVVGSDWPTFHQMSSRALQLEIGEAIGIDEEQGGLEKEPLFLTPDSMLQSVLELVNDSVSTPATPSCLLSDLGLDSHREAHLGFRLKRLVGGRPVPQNIFNLSVQELAESLYQMQRPSCPGLHVAGTGSSHTRVSVVGIDCKFAMSDGPAEFWTLMSNVDSSKDFQAIGTSHERQGSPGAFVKNPWDFDNTLFKTPELEAKLMDPQQRWLLEGTYQSLHDAGFDPLKVSDKGRAGVFVALSCNEFQIYIGLLFQNSTINGHIATGTSYAVASGRIAHFFGCTGRTETIDTACSGAGVCLDKAMLVFEQRLAPMDTAIVGAANIVNLLPFVSDALDHQGMLSPNNKCFTFDERANGYVRGDGCVSLILRRADGLEGLSPQHCKVLGVASNHCGRSSSHIAAPSYDQQVEVISLALEAAGLSKEEIPVFAAHGTGTKHGDLVELRTLEAQRTEKASTPLIVLATKPGVGHTEAPAAGADIINIINCFKHRKLLRLQGLQVPSATLKELEEKRILLACRENIPWKAIDTSTPRRAGVNTFGFSGTNCCAILEEAGRDDENADSGDADAVGAESWATPAPLQLPWLQGSDKESEEVVHSVLLFTGQGIKNQGLDRAQYDADERLRTCIDKCNKILLERHNFNLLEYLFESPSNVDTQLLGPLQAQLASVAVQCAFAECWRGSERPLHYVAGHSLGEYSALFAADFLDLPTVFDLVACRARCIAALPAGEGQMWFVPTSAEAVEDVIFRHGIDTVSIACVNHGEQVILAGPSQEVKEIALAASPTRARHLSQMSHAFHCEWQMESILPKFKEEVGEILGNCSSLSGSSGSARTTSTSTTTTMAPDSPDSPDSPKGSNPVQQRSPQMISSVTGQLVKDANEVLTVEHLTTNLKDQVNWLGAMETLFSIPELENVVLQEVGGNVVGKLSMTVHRQLGSPVKVSAWHWTLGKEGPQQIPALPDCSKCRVESARSSRSRHIFNRRELKFELNSSESDSVEPQRKPKTLEQCLDLVHECLRETTNRDLTEDSEGQEQELMLVGIDSMHIPALQHQLEQKSGCKLTPEEVLQNTCSSLAALILERQAAAAAPSDGNMTDAANTAPAGNSPSAQGRGRGLPRSDWLLPLHPFQRLFLPTNQGLQSTTSEETIYLEVELSGPLDVTRFSEALQRTVLQHTSLRLRLANQENVAWLRIAESEAVNALKYLQVCTWTTPEELEEFRRQYAERELDLVHDGPIQLALIQKVGGAGESEDGNTHSQEEVQSWTLMLVVHHIAFDGASAPVLLHTLASEYAERHWEPPAQFYDMEVPGVEEQGRREKFWSEQLKALSVPLQLPQIDAPSSSREASRLTWEMPEDILAAIPGVAASTFSILLSSFAMVLFNHSGQSDVVVGVPVCAFPRSGAFSNMVGLSMQVAPVRLALPALTTSAPEFIAEVHAKVKEAKDNLLPSDDVLRLSDVPGQLNGKHPLYQVLFNEVEEPAGNPFEGTGLRFTTRPSQPPRTTSFYLEVIMLKKERGRKRELIVDFDKGRFSEPFVERLVKDFFELSQTLVKKMKSDRTASLVELVPPSIVTNCQEAVQFKAIPDQIARVAKGSVATVTVEDGKVAEWTYDQLEVISRRFQKYLRSAGVCSGHFVALHMPIGPDYVAWMLATLKSGAAYLVLDYEEGGQDVVRLKHYIDDAQPKAVVVRTRADLRGLDADGEGWQPTWSILESETASAEGYGELRDECEVKVAAPAPEDPFYLLFTSGSTGKPKGVLVSHGNLSCFVEGARAKLEVQEHDRVVCATKPSFDLHVTEIWLPLSNGASVAMTPKDWWEKRSADAFVSTLQDSQATLVQATPTVYQHLLGSSTHAFPWRGGQGLRFVSGGEKMLQAVQEQLLQSGRVFNGYGPTEATVVVAFKEILSVGTPVAVVGKPLPNYGVVVVHKCEDPSGSRLHIVPCGQTGELAISGHGVALGYLKRDELTQDRFRHLEGVGRVYCTGDLGRILPHTGEIEILGRMDSQRKIRGHRVELDGIEVAVEASPSVNKAVAITVGEGEDAHVRVYVSPQNANLEEIQRILLMSPLLQVAYPQMYVCLDNWPLLSNGKIDRALLDREYESYTWAVPVPGSKEPSNEQESEVLAVFKEIYGGKCEMFMDTPVFQFGSALLARLWLKLKVKFGIEPDLEVFKGEANSTADCVIELMHAKVFGSPTPKFQKNTQVANGAKSLVYVLPPHGFPFALERLINHFPKTVKVARVRDALEDSWQKTAEAACDDLVQRTTPGVSVILLGFSAGGWLLAQMLPILAERGVHVDGNIILDATFEIPELGGREDFRRRVRAPGGLCDNDEEENDLWEKVVSTRRLAKSRSPAPNFKFRSPTLVVQAAQGVHAAREPDLGWKRFDSSECLTSVTVEGDHFGVPAAAGETVAAFIEKIIR